MVQIEAIQPSKIMLHHPMHVFKCMNDIKLHHNVVLMVCYILYIKIIVQQCISQIMLMMLWTISSWSSSISKKEEYFIQYSFFKKLECKTNSSHRKISVGNVVGMQPSDGHHGSSLMTSFLSQPHCPILSQNFQYFSQCTPQSKFGD